MLAWHGGKDDLGNDSLDSTSIHYVAKAGLDVLLLPSAGITGVRLESAGFCEKDYGFLSDSVPQDALPQTTSPSPRVSSVRRGGRVCLGG